MSRNKEHGPNGAAAEGGRIHWGRRRRQCLCVLCFCSFILLYYEYFIIVKYYFGFLLKLQTQVIRVPHGLHWPLYFDAPYNATGLHRPQGSCKSNKRRDRSLSIPTCLCLKGEVSTASHGLFSQHLNFSC